MLELSTNELKEVAGGHCLCHCTARIAVSPYVSSGHECDEWCRKSGHGSMASCDGNITFSCNIQ